MIWVLGFGKASLDRTCLFSGQGLCLFVVLKKKTTQKNIKKKQNKPRGFWFQGPYVDPDADPPWRLDSFAFSRGFLWKNWFCFGFLFRVMYSVDTFLHRDVLLSYIKLISTCDLMRSGVAWGGREEPVWEDVVPGRLGGTLLYHCTVWQANYKWRLKADTYCLLKSLFNFTRKTETIARQIGIGGAPGPTTVCCFYSRQ